MSPDPDTSAVPALCHGEILPGLRFAIKAVDEEPAESAAKAAPIQPPGAGADLGRARVAATVALVHPDAG